jgi:hypothetical protein
MRGLVAVLDKLEELTPQQRAIFGIVASRRGGSFRAMLSPTSCAETARMVALLLCWLVPATFSPFASAICAIGASPFRRIGGGG